MEPSTNQGRNFPDYENPPVIEVVCGLLFKPLRKFLTPHVGLLWEQYKPEYTECSEVAPLDAEIERFESSSSQMTLEIANVPPLPRVWFIHQDGNSLIQVQRDRFLHNWRKNSPEDAYPRYHAIKETLRKRFIKFQSFLEEHQLGPIEPLQYEMTYINHIPQGEGWKTLGEIGELFPDFPFQFNKERFLPEPSTVNWRTTFALPEKTARMHVAIRHVRLRSSGLPIILLELSVRGMGEESSTIGMWDWFDLAREWIVRGFADLTGERVQKEIWKRQY